ncbi:hypothetical protein LWI29_007971 [Acer saccharum]|uniref:Uncharacterized protein n=1 Tax=Acer saccharum TaxID=4024 RepID=A0AA39RPB7_ACESA|nr:hypothetical protein LWI29_007971 [Acer saccharum]
MDPSLRSSLFNRMMQAMELGDKCTADKIESLIHNFRPDSPVPISVYVPSFEDTFNPDISPPSFNSDSPAMPRSPKTTSSKRRASRAPRESLLDAQTLVDSDVEDHQRDRLLFSPTRPCSFDTEVNVVGEGELHKYKSRFDIPDSVTLMLPGDRAVWNPPENAVAIYGAMLSCGVTLPLQPFIARFLTEAQIAPAQLAPNSYRILMCLCLMWKLKGYGPPTPREIRHFYTLRQAGNGGTYFLLSSPVENWIPEGVANPGQVEVSSDEKKKGFIWGFPTSNKKWKNSWFFTGGEWGRDVPALNRRNLLARKVPRHFTSSEAWSKAAPVLMDRKVSHLAAAAVLPLESRGRSYLLDEEKMISLEIFTRLHARLPRLCDFDTVCDLQARAVKNSEAASKRHAAGLAKDGIASPDGDDHSDGEEAGDISRGVAESGRPPMHAESAANTPTATVAAAPSRKGKEKVGASGGVVMLKGGVPSRGHPLFARRLLRVLLLPSSDLIPRAGRGKRLAEGTPDHAARPLKRASRVVQYVVSSDEEVIEEPVLAEAPSAETAVPGASAERPDPVEDPAESPLPEGANDFDASTIPQASATPPPVTADRPGASFIGQPGPPGRKEPTEKPGSSRQDEATTSGSGVAHEAPPVDPIEAGEGVETVSLSDFTAAEICTYIMNNNVYVGEDWEELKKRSCNRKMEFFFNCHSLVSLSLCFRILVLAFPDFCFFLFSCCPSWLTIIGGEIFYQRISASREQLSASQESLAARFDTERLAEEAKEKAEREALDLRNQLTSQEVILNDLKAVLEVEAVDRFKRSPAYDALLLREFEKGMRQAKKFFAMKDHSNDKALRRFDRSLQQHMADGVDSIKEQTKRWRAHCRYNRTEPHPMHLEIPSKRAFNTYYSGQKGSFSGSGAEPDLGPVAGRDYEPFMPEEDEEDSEGPPAAG